jgi:hypothetical protein
MSDVVIRFPDGVPMIGSVGIHDGRFVLVSKDLKPCTVLLESYVLPERHGDLIDKDAAMNAILGEPTDAHYPSWFAGVVNDVPALVPSKGV